MSGRWHRPGHSINEVPMERRDRSLPGSCFILAVVAHHAPTPPTVTNVGPPSRIVRGSVSVAEPCPLPLLHSAWFAVRDHQGVETAPFIYCRTPAALAIGLVSAEAVCEEAILPGLTNRERTLGLWIFWQLQWCECFSFCAHARNNDASGRVRAR